MDKNIEVLLIDDDLIHLDILKKKFQNIGIGNIVSKNTFESAKEYIFDNVPDLIFCDFYLDNFKTAKDLIDNCLTKKNIPIIIVSTFYDTNVLNELNKYNIHDFLPKNMTEFDIEKSIQISSINLAHQLSETKFNNFFLVRSGGEIKKVNLSDILYIGIDGKYVEIFLDNAKYAIRSSLTDFEKRLPENFIRVHKAYVINLIYLESIRAEENTLKIRNKVLPIGGLYKKNLLNFYIS